MNNYKKLNKNYRETNKDIIRKKKSEYYIKNLEHIKAKRGEKYTCECGSLLTLCKKSRHEQTKKHLKYLAIPKTK